MNKKAVKAIDASIKKYEQKIEVLKAFKGKEVKCTYSDFVISYYDSEKRLDIVLVECNSDSCPLCKYAELECTRCPIVKVKGCKCDACINTPWDRLVETLDNIKQKENLIINYRVINLFRNELRFLKRIREKYITL